MKSNISNIIASVTVILIGLMLGSCSGEEIIVLSSTVDNIIYNFDNQKNEATATGYTVDNGIIKTNITIPATVTCANTVYDVTGVAKQAFAHGGWESVSIGENVRSIGEGAFSDCDRINTVRLCGLTAPSVSANSFDQAVYENATLIIEKSLDIEDTHWALFKNIMRI